MYFWLITLQQTKDDLMNSLTMYCLGLAFLKEITAAIITNAKFLGRFWKRAARFYISPISVVEFDIFLAKCHSVKQFSDKSTFLETKLTNHKKRV